MQKIKYYHEVLGLLHIIATLTDTTKAEIETRRFVAGELRDLADKIDYIGMGSDAKD